MSRIHLRWASAKSKFSTMTTNNPLLSTTFKYENHIYTVDTVNQPGLWRQNAMTAYQFVFPYIILATEITVQPNVGITNGPKLFYLIFTRENHWLPVDVNTGENLVNIFKS